MVKSSELAFVETKTLPTIKLFRDRYSFTYNTDNKWYENIKQGGLNYPLAEFVSHYYELDFKDFRVKFHNRIGSKLNGKGYIVEIADLMS